MKGFKNSTRMSSGFKFPESAGFSSSSGKVQQVRGYTRAVVKRATGGQVPGHAVTKGAYSGAATTIGDQGNSAELRTKPISEFDKDHGGKGPLRPGLGFALGGGVGMAAPLRAAVGAVTRSAGGNPAMRTAIPRGGMGRRPLMRAKGGKVSGLASWLKHNAGESPKEVPAREQLAKSAMKSAVRRGVDPQDSHPAFATQYEKKVRDKLRSNPDAKFADGGKVPPKKPPPPPKPDPTQKGTTPMDALQGRKKQQMEDLGLAKGGFLGFRKKHR